MFEFFDLDVVFNWKFFQVAKWIFGGVIVIALVFLINQNMRYKEQLWKENMEHQTDINVIRKVLFDTKVSDKKVIRLLQKYFIDK